MSFLNKVFQSIPVKIPDRSGFDLSHEVLSTAKVGTVTPITHFEVIPGDTISMGSLMKVTLPPMAVPFMGRIDAELTAAFIPYRLLWQGWQSFITQNNGVQNAGVPGHNLVGGTPMSVPLIEISNDDIPNNRTNWDALAGNLADYLGVKFEAGDNIPIDQHKYVSAMKFLAYHKFCDDWIRDDNNMKPFFPKVFTRSMPTGSDTPSTTTIGGVGILPFDAYGGSMPTTDAGYVVPTFRLSDKPVVNAGIDTLGVDSTLRLGALRQRCWAKDYFTTATTRPQAGAASSVMFDTSGATGSFTISTLRAANSLQKWMERNNIAGTEYGDQIMAHFGVRPPDAVLNRSVLLGSVRTPVYVGSVENKAGVGDNGASGTKSPFGNVLGAAAGFASGGDKGTLIDDFTVKEHGVIMVFFTLIPHAYYNTGTDREMNHVGYGDFAWPEFANIGDQEIKNSELVASANTAGIFGYNQRYSEYKFLKDRIAGLLRQGQTLEVYALQRSFIYPHPELGKDFLTIPTDFLDQVTGVSSELSKFGCMVDAYFDCQALRILPEYSLPSL